MQHTFAVLDEFTSESGYRAFSPKNQPLIFHARGVTPTTNTDNLFTEDRQPVSVTEEPAVFMTQ